MSREDRIKVDEYAKAILAGNSRAFDELYKLCKTSLCFVGHRHHEIPEDVEEIVDDVFELFLKKLPYFMFIKGCYYWLVRATVKKVIAFRRKQCRRNEILQTIPVATYIKFDEAKAHFFIEVSKLQPPQLQHLVIYKYYCKLKIFELELLFKISRATIYRELKVAQSILKEKLIWKN